MDESQGDVSGVFDALATDYDRRWAFYVRASVDETLARLPSPAGGRVCDVGCGTGELLRFLLREDPSARVVGIDLSREMLAVARDKLGEGPGLVVADAARIPLTTGCLDLVVSTNSLHFWQDMSAGLREIGRVLRPGGRLVLTDWCDDYWACRICDRFLRVFDPAHQRTYGADDLARLLEVAGFEGVGVERYRISWLWGLMTAEATTAP